MNTNLEIDRLRAIAVLITMYAHINYLLLGEWGWYTQVQPLWNASIGVYIFFAISGYLISTTLLADFDKSFDKGAAILRFWVRRFTRIMPLALIWIAVPLVLSAVFNSRGIFHRFEDNLPAAIAAALYHFNLYVATAGSASGFGPYWSLSLEEQFYFLFPVFALLVRGRWTRLAVLLLALVAMSFAPGWLSSLRMDGLIIGVALALVVQRPPHDERAQRRIPKLVGFSATFALITLIVATPQLLKLMGLGAHLVPALGLMSAFLVFLAIQERGFILPVTGWAQRSVGWIGTRSFGLYLIHLPAYMTAGEVTWRLQMFDTILGRSCIALILLLVATELSYRLIEQPARKWGRCIQISGRTAHRVPLAAQ